MLIQHIRWQVLLALSGIVLLLTMLGVIAGNVQTVLLPQAGGTYVEGVPSSPDNLNPLFLPSASRAENDVAALLFNGLTRADATGAILPDLAASWQVAEDGSTYTFALRPGLLWHDGAAFTADDIVFTVGIIQDAAFSGTVTGLELLRTVEVEALGPRAVRFTLPRTVTPFAPFLSFTSFPILPRHLLADIPVSALAAAPFSRFPIGTGPWRIVQEEPDRIVLEPHPAFPGPRPMLERIVLRFYADVPAALQAMRRGEVMGVAGVRAEDMGRVLADSSLVPYSAPESGYTAVFFNLRNPLFQQLEVRQALLLGLDRPQLIQDTLGGQGVLAHGFLMPTHWAYDADLPRYPFQPEEAAELLDKAGWRDTDEDGIREREGRPVTFTMLTVASEPQLVRVVDEIAQQWRELGIRATPQVVANAEELRRILRTRDFDLFVLATPTSGLPTDPDFYPLWHSSQVTEDGQNYTAYATEQSDRLLVEGRLTLDPIQRRDIYQEFQDLLARDLPALPLYHPIYNYVVRDLVQDVQVGLLTSSSERFLSLPAWYIKTQRLMLPRGAPTPTPAPLQP